MTNVNYNFNQTINQNQSDHNFSDFLEQHRLFAILIAISIFTLLIAVIIIIFTSNTEPKQEPEEAPYITFENEQILEHPIYKELDDEILFNLNLILADNDEIASAPTDNSGNQNHVVTFIQKSLTTKKIENGELYTINLDVSDGRQYLLKLLISYEYHNEYAVAVLDRIEQPNARDYVIAFTSYTSEYYATLGTNNANSSNNSSSIVDHFSGAPLNPLPEAAIKWINSLKLNDPQFIYTVLPSIR